MRNHLKSSWPQIKEWSSSVDAVNYALISILRCLAYEEIVRLSFYVVELWSILSVL